MKKRQVVFSLMLFVMVCIFSFAAVSAAELKIMSYDFTAGANAADVYTIANGESPDIIGAQACVKTAVDHFNANGYRHAGIDRDGGTSGEYNPIFYKTNHLSLVDSGTFWLSDTPYAVGSQVANSICKRICTFAVFRTKDTGDQFVVFNTHLDHSNDTVRAQQVEKLLAVAKKYSLPMVLLGSFNATKGSSVYQKAISTGLLDAQDLAPITDNGQTYHGHGASTSTAPQDYCFVSPNHFTVKAYTIVRTKLANGTYPSNYYPVLVKLSVNAVPVEPETIRVMSFNVRVGEFVDPRKGYVVQTVRKYSPDLMGVQEASVQWMEYLNANLSGDYNYIGIGRDPNSTGEYSAIFYKKNMFTVIDSGTFWLSETPDTCSYGWDAACRRVCTWGVFRNNHTDEVFAYFNTHTDHQSGTARANGMAVVLERVKALGFPAFLTGDLNLHEGSSVYKTITSEVFDDSKFLATSSDTGGTYHGYGTVDTTTNTPIDFAMVTKNDFVVDNYKVVRDKYGSEFVSDHYPVYMDVRMAKRTNEKENTVMSFDLSGAGSGDNAVANRVKRGLAVIQMYNPDVIGFQAENSVWQEGLAPLRDRYATVGVSRDANANGEMNRIYYLKKKYELVDSGQFWLSETPDVVGSSSWNADCPRICVYAVLKNRLTNEVFAVYNTHLDHVSKEAREKGLAILLDKIQAMGYPAVLTGTLQENENDTIYAITGAKLSDAKYTAKDSDTGATYHGFEGTIGVQPKDYVFLSDNFFEVASYKIIRNKIGGFYPSPYYPLLCKFRFKYDLGVTVRDNTVTVTDTRTAGEDAYLYLAQYDADGRMISCTSSGKITKNTSKTMAADGNFALYAWDEVYCPIKDKYTGK